MASIFISHSSKDNAWARKLKEWLEPEPRAHRSLFLDFDGEAGLRAGDLWEQQLYAKLRQCQVVLALVSHGWLESRWCFAEAVQAREKGKRLILARIDDADTSNLFRDAQHLDFTYDEADAFARLEVALADVFDVRSGREPYPGLVPFDEFDAGVFVGRDPEIAALLEMLESMRLKSRSGERLLLLLGASGSGKSSLVRAGVLPRLRRLPERWQVLPPMRPGLDPVRELARSIATSLQQAQLGTLVDQLAVTDQGGAGPLLDLVDEVLLQARQSEPTGLLVLDQMEELLGLSQAEARGQFLDLLRRALEQGDGRLLVLATLRSEYLGEVQILPFLTTPTPLPYREQTLDPVPLDRLDTIIREPGRRWPQPVEFADRLVERIVRDTGTRDALPLLAFTLNRLWRDAAARADGVFQSDEYERLGGLEGSVRTAADEALVLPRRTPAELEALRETFVPGLVRVDAEGVRTRRRAFLADLAPATRAVLKPFVDLGLLVTDRDPDGRETIEVAHEALLRTWPHLDRWLEEDQDALRLLDGLERAARDWEEGARSPELLAHRGGRLSEVQALLDQRRFRRVVGDAERRYLETSIQAEVERDAREREDRERRVRDAERIAEEQRKVAWRTKVGALIALSLMLVAAAFGLYAWDRRGAAEQQRIIAEQQSTLADQAAARARERAEEADRQREIAISRQLAAQALQLANLGRGSEAIERAGAFAVESWRRRGNPDAYAAAVKLLEKLPRSAFEHTGRITDVAFSPDGRWLATWELESPNPAVRLFEVATGTETVRVEHGGELTDIMISPDSRWLATAVEDGPVRLVETATGRETARVEHGGEVVDIVFSPDSRLLAIAVDEEAVRLIEAATGTETVRMKHDQTVNDVEFSLDGRWLATASDGAARLFEVATGRETARVEHDGLVYDVEFSPDGRWLATAGDDGAAPLFDVAAGRETARVEHEDEVHAVAFSPDGRWLVTGSEDSTTSLVEVATGRRVARIEQNGKYAPEFSPDGRLFAVESLDSTVRLFETATGREMARVEHPAEVTDVAFSPDGRWLATADEDDSVRLFEPATGHETVRIEHGGKVSGLAFSPDGRWLATASEDGRVRLFEIGAQVAWIEHGASVRVATFSPDGRVFATASEDGTVRLVETSTGRQVARIEHGGEVLEFSPNGWLLATEGENDGVMRLFETASGRELTDVRRDGKAWDINFSLDGRFAAIVGGKGTVTRLIDAASGRELARVEHPGRVRDVAFSPDGRLFATVNEDGTFRLVEVATGTETVRVEHGGGVTVVEFSPDGRYVVTSSNEDIIRLYESASGRELARVQHIRFFKFSPDSRWLDARSIDGMTWVIETATGRSAGSLGHGGQIGGAVAFSPDGRWLATWELKRSPNPAVRLFEVATGRETVRFEHDGQLIDIVFSPDSRWLATAVEDGPVRLVETATGRETARVEHGGEVVDIVFSPDSRWLATAVEDEAVRLVEAATGRETARIEHGGEVVDIVFSPDSRWLATAVEDEAVRLVEAATGRETARIEHGGGVTDVTFSPDSRWLATAGKDGTARLVNTGADREIARVEHGPPVTDVAFSPDGSWLLLTGGAFVERLPADPQDVIDRLCKLAGRNLSLVEWQNYVDRQDAWRPTCPDGGWRTPK